MAIKISDIEFFLSGGPTNSNPNSSIGGLPSSFVIFGTLNNLFSDVTTEQASDGKTDYRCFYVSNKSETDPLYESQVYVVEQGSADSYVQIGVHKTTEIQRINIIGPVYFGKLVLRYEQNQFEAAWGSSAGEFETNLQAALRSNGAPGVVVSTLPQGNNYQITISFSGESDNRSHPVLQIVSNELLAPDTPIVSVSKVTDGSPINSVAPTLAVDTVPPARVSFLDTSENSKLYLGTLNPGDYVPVWVKRIVPVSSDYAERDYFTLKISGRPF